MGYPAQTVLQGGPVGEGRILDGCITCPWHGFQYDPKSGSSPPPFTEKVPTFKTRVENGRVHVDAGPLPAGTEVKLASCGIGSKAVETNPDVLS